MDVSLQGTAISTNELVAILEKEKIQTNPEQQQHQISQFNSDNTSAKNSNKEFKLEFRLSPRMLY